LIERRKEKILSRTAFRKLAAMLVILLVLCIGTMISTQISEVHAARSRVFTEDFNTYSNTWWTTYDIGTPSIESGALKLPGPGGPSGCHSAVYSRYVNWTWRAKVSATPTAGYEPLVALLTNYTEGSDKTNSIYVSFNYDLKLSGQCRKEGGLNYQNIGTYSVNSWQNIMIIWDSGTVKFYVNGTLQFTSSTYIIQSRAKVFLRNPAGSGYNLYVDYVYLEEDRSSTYVTPHVSYANITNWLNPSWTESNKTLWASMTGGGTYAYKVYIPSSYLNYFAEVKVNGNPHTNIAFNMPTHELSVKGLTGTVVSVQLVDPPQVLVNLYYWLLGFGISIAPLLKLWDKLAKIHKLLPYVVIAVAIVFLCAAAWYAWQFFTAIKLQ